jgi:vanillate O-demethylase monooxygenase subunit
VAEWINLGCTAPGLFQNKVPSPAKCDYWIEVAWQAPAVMFLATAVVPQGQPRQPADEILVLHNMTPETARTTHYFACGTRAFRVEDAELTRRSQTAVRHAFMNEDKPMLEAQQRRMGEADFWSLRPVVLPGDAAAIRVRRELAKLIETEEKSAGSKEPS